MSAARPRFRTLLLLLGGSPPEAALASIDELSRELADQCDLEALLVGGDATDGRLEHARDGEPARPPVPLRVLTSARSLGPGDRQKLGLQFAVENRFDFAIALESVADHPPESLSRVLAPLASGDADAVLGVDLGAGKRRGGLSNVARRVLSSIENRILGSAFPDFHAPLRAYAVSALERIPFPLDTSDVHIDTEILIQLFLARQRIRTVEVPRLGSSRGLRKPAARYAWNSLRAVARARMQEMNLFYDRRLDCAPVERENQHYEAKLDFDSTHTRVMAKVPRGARVLDLGCAGGYLADALERRLGCRVTAVDRDPLPAGVETSAFVQWNLDDGPPSVDYVDQDVVLLLDVIEHLVSPEQFLRKLYAATAQAPSLRLIVTTGNVAFLFTRLMLLAGQFNYGKRGILDLTHTRLFTFGTFRRLLEQEGFRVTAREGVPAPFPLAIRNRSMSRALLAINRALIGLLPGVFAYQILLVLEPRPSLGLLLREAEPARATREHSLSDPKARASLS